MENTKYGKLREGRWTPIRAKAQDTRAKHNSWETHLVRKRWDIGLLRALSLRIMMKMMMSLEMMSVSFYHPRLCHKMKMKIQENHPEHLAELINLSKKNKNYLYVKFD